MTVQMFVKRGGKIYGPYSLSQLKAAACAGKLRPEDLVSRDQDDWVRASEAVELESFGPSIEAPPVIAKSPTAEVLGKDESSAKSSIRPRRSTGNLKAVLVWSLVLLAACSIGGNISLFFAFQQHSEQRGQRVKRGQLTSLRRKLKQGSHRPWHMPPINRRPLRPLWPPKVQKPGGLKPKPRPDSGDTWLKPRERPKNCTQVQIP